MFSENEFCGVEMEEGVYATGFLDEILPEENMFTVLMLANHFENAVVSYFGNFRIYGKQEENGERIFAAVPWELAKIRAKRDGGLNCKLVAVTVPSVHKILTRDRSSFEFPRVFQQEM